MITNVTLLNLVPGPTVIKINLLLYQAEVISCRDLQPDIMHAEGDSKLKVSLGTFALEIREL